MMSCLARLVEQPKQGEPANAAKIGQIAPKQ